MALFYTELINQIVFIVSTNCVLYSSIFINEAIRNQYVCRIQELRANKLYFQISSTSKSVSGGVMRYTILLLLEEL